MKKVVHVNFLKRKVNFFSHKSVILYKKNQILLLHATYLL